MKTPKIPQLGLELGTIALTRTVVTSFYRMMYPFLPIIARGLDVSLSSVALVLAARSGLAFIIPSFGLLSDRWGRKNMFVIGIGLFVIGIFAIFLRPYYPVFFCGVLIASAAKFIFDLSTQAYTGDHVPYSRRGLAIAFIEGSWSSAFLLGVPLIGWLMESGGWLRPFPMLAISGLIMGILILRNVPAQEPSTRGENTVLKLREVLKKPSVLVMIVSMGLVHMGVQQLYISYGARLMRQHNCICFGILTHISEHIVILG